jgi:hypothetical protein
MNPLRTAERERRAPISVIFEAANADELQIQALASHSCAAARVPKMLKNRSRRSARSPPRRTRLTSEVTEGNTGRVRRERPRVRAKD